MREGARAVIATDMRVDQADVIREKIASEHGDGRFLLVEHDVTDESAWRRVVALALEVV